MLRKNDLLTFLAISSAVFVLYGATACRTVGPGDSGELTAVMCTWGVAHAPGYPLLSLIGNLVSRLFHFGEPALVLNLLSASFGALAASFVGLAVHTLTRRMGAGLIAGLALGTSRVFWEYSLVVEVFSMNSLFGALLLFFLARFIRGIQDKAIVTWPLPASALVMSTAVTHHLTLVLVALPVLAVFVAAVLFSAAQRKAAGPTRFEGPFESRRVRRVVLLSAALGVLGLLPVLYLPLAARHDPILNWGAPSDPTRLVHLLQRKDFGSGTLMSPWLVATTLLENGESVSPLGGLHFWRYWMEIPRNFGWPFTVLPLLGVAWAVTRSRHLVIFLAGFLAMLGIFFARVNSPVLPLFLGVTERFYILPNVVLSFFAGLGAAGLAGLIRSPRLTALFQACLALATAGIMGVIHAPHVDMSRNTFTRDLGANFMAGMPEDAIVLSEGDLLHNAFYYQQACLKKRPDLELIDQQKLSYAWYVELVRRRGRFKLPDDMKSYSQDSKTHAKAWLDLNLERKDGPGRPIVLVSLRDQSTAKDYRITPQGLWWRAWRKEEVPPISSQAAAFENTVRQWDLGSASRRYHKRSWETAQIMVYVRALSLLGAIQDLAQDLSSGQAELEADPQAARWLEQALSLSSGDRATVLAYQAELYHRVLADGVTDFAPAGGALPVIKKTIALAEGAVEADETNTAALRILAPLMKADPEGYDRKREIKIRQLLLEKTPGNAESLAAYVQLVIDMSNDPATKDVALLADAVERQKRYLKLLDQAILLCDQPHLSQSREQWRGYLRNSEAMLRSPGP